MPKEKNLEQIIRESKNDFEAKKNLKRKGYDIEIEMIENSFGTSRYILKAIKDGKVELGAEYLNQDLVDIH